MDRADYAQAAAAFSLQRAKAAFAGDFEQGINACVECCDRWADDPLRVALHWRRADGRAATLRFAELRAAAARLANLLVEQGIGRGDVVAAMLPRTPELLAVILGTWRAGAVYQPLFTAFGPQAVAQRLGMSGARLVVTDVANRAKFDGLAGPRVALLADAVAAGDLDLRAGLARQCEDFAPVPRSGDDLFLMMSTSGTTGPAKGVPVPLKALLNFRAYMVDAVDLQPGDRYWNIADPGWAYGLYYAVAGPLLLGHATTFYDGPFSAESTWRVLRELGITNLAGAPTAFRLLIAGGVEDAAPFAGQLRCVSSAGEPLNPEVIRWFDSHLQAPIRDHYGQTELGMVVNNHHGLRHVVHAGAAGLPMPGYRVCVLDAQQRELGPGEPGELAVDTANSPLFWFRGYLGQPAPGRYYRSGDSVELSADGHVVFIGRTDDVITSSGYRIGPFEVESALLEHPAVVEAAVVGKPDAQRTEIVKAFVVPAAGRVADSALAEELARFVKHRLSAHAYPREIEFIAQLPKTPSGKVQRYLLRRAGAAPV